MNEKSFRICKTLHKILRGRSQMNSLFLINLSPQLLVSLEEAPYVKSPVMNLSHFPPSNSFMSNYFPVALWLFTSLISPLFILSFHERSKAQESHSGFAFWQDILIECERTSKLSKLHSYPFFSDYSFSTLI